MSAEAAAAVVDGAIHLIQQPTALAMLASVFLMTRDLQTRDAAAALALFAAGAMVTLALEPAAWHSMFVAACLTALGGACAAGVRGSSWWAQLACAAAGLAVGFSGGLPIATVAEAIGTTAVPCILLPMLHTGWRLAGARRLSAPAWRAAPRVVAAWVAAIGLLMLALDLNRYLKTPL